MTVPTKTPLIKIIMTTGINKPIAYGILASAILLGFYFTALTFVSGWNFAKDQFFTYWYFVVSLAIGFGIQVGLFIYLKSLVKNRNESGKILGVTGAASTAAMVSCCAHYLVNLLPILGDAGIVTFVAQYQIQLFWIGLSFNIVGVMHITNKIIKFKHV